jgi:2-keto-4-pentenoate hydratase/2-oxohepta-3-ene-1,7-dioic acid hydratase in catechol pathway
MQDSNTKEMIFNISELIEFVSRNITLNPGDVISTGTPNGVGTFRKPPVYMKPGDEIKIEIEKIGTLINKIAKDNIIDN